MVDPIEVNGQKLYRVEVEERRSATFYVLADSQTEAEAEAKVLGDELDEWDEVEEVDVTTTPARTAPTDERDMVWVGGETGAWREWGELDGG